MDRLSQLRVDAGGSGDSTLDTTSPPSEAFMSANENSSKYFSLSDSTFDITPIKDVSLASTSADADQSSDELMPNLSPIGKKDVSNSYKIGKQIEAANILSGGVDIFDDNDNSFDGDELVIDDNVEVDDISNPDNVEQARAQVIEPPEVLEETFEVMEETQEIIEKLPKVIEQCPEVIEDLPDAIVDPPEVIEAPPVAMEETTGVIEEHAEAFNEPSEAIQAPPEAIQAPPEAIQAPPEVIQSTPEVIEESPAVGEPNAAEQMEVLLHIDGTNVNAIDIGNGLYLYRRDGQQELAAIQILDGDPQHTFKFLKVRDNAEGNLEVYEEIEIEVSKEVPTEEKNSIDSTTNVPVNNISKDVSDSSHNKVAARSNKTPQYEPVASTSKLAEKNREEKEKSPELKREVNLNGKMKFSETRKSPIVGSFKPMTFHSTPNKEGKPLTKTMIDLQLDPNRHSDNVKKTIEVHTDNIKPKSTESLSKEKELSAKQCGTTKKSDIKEQDIKKDIHESLYSDAKPSTSVEGRLNNEIIVDKKTDDVNRKHDAKNAFLDGKPRVYIQELVKPELETNNMRNAAKEQLANDVKPKEVVQNKVSVKETEPINRKESDKASLKPDMEVVLVHSSIARKANEDAVTTTAVVNVTENKSKITEKPIVKSNQSIEVNVTKVTEKFAKDKPEGTVRKDALLSEKDENETLDETIEVKEVSPSKTKAVGNITLISPSDSAGKAVDTKVVSSLKIDDERKVTSEGSEELQHTNVISVEDIPTTKPCTTKTKDDKENKEINNISVIPMKHSNISSSLIENTDIDKQKCKALTATLNECNVEKNNQIDSTTTTGQTSMYSKSERSSPEQRIKDKSSSSIPLLEIIPSEKQEPVLVPEVKTLEKSSDTIALEKPASSNPVPKTKPVDTEPPVLLPTVKYSEKTRADNSIPLEVAVNVGGPVLQAFEKVSHACHVLEKTSVTVASSTSLPEIRRLEKTSQALATPHVTTSQKTSVSISSKSFNIADPTCSEKLVLSSVPAVKCSEKAAANSNAALELKSIKKAASTSVPLIKSLGKAAHTIPVQSVKHPANAALSTPVTEINPEKVTSAFVEVKASVPAAMSIPVLKLKSSAIPKFLASEKTAPSIIVPNATPSEKALRTPTHIDVKLSAKEAETSTMTKIKSSEKIVPCKGVKPSEKAVHSVLPPLVKSLETTAPLSLLPVKPHVPITANISYKPSTKKMLIVPKPDAIAETNDNISITKEVTIKSNDVDKKNIQMRIESQEIKESLSKPNPEPMPVNNNHTAAVPFGKWTDVNRQEFLNKFKEVKVPANTNSKQIKNSNDLNRRDVLKKIDSQRAQTIINNATAKAQEKLNVKNETVFTTKVVSSKEESVKNESAEIKPKQAPIKVTCKQENTQKALESNMSTNSATVKTVHKIELVPKVEPRPKSTATMASLIDRTIEDMINKVVPFPKTVTDEPKQTKKVNSESTDPAAPPVSLQLVDKPESVDVVSLDDIEMKMNELHGIPFVERPPHELPKLIKVNKKEKESLGKVTKIICSTNENKMVNDNVIDIDSEEEVIEHEPITGDIELNKKTINNTKSTQEKKTLSEKSSTSVVSKATSSKDPVLNITETDFDKFARRNSITYENCLTVSYERKQDPHVIIQTAIEKDPAPKGNSKTETIRIEAKTKVPHKQTGQMIHTDKPQGLTKYGAVVGDTNNKNYQSKIHSAYQSALTAKHHSPQPITIIEDRPVKVVFVENTTEFVPSQLNVQGKELSPSKNPPTDFNDSVITNTEYIDSDMLEIIDENKQQDKSKTKHQRKQVLTPVEAPELELIEPSDLSFEASPKKKRKIEDNKTDKQSKNLVHKKSYLLGRNITDDKTADPQVTVNELPKEPPNHRDMREHKDTASAIDNLVKAAELLENQAEILNKAIIPNPDSQPDTPVKRGRGRPRKYPLPDGENDNKTPSPQKKPRLIDSKPRVKQESISDEHEDDSSGEEMVRENWTMGKINENIVCPICNKLFRSENVVFKHVKHCTGESPNRSESDKMSPRRSRLSQDSDDMDMDDDKPLIESKKDTPKKRKSKEKVEIKTEEHEPKVEKEDVIIIEDTPVKAKSEKHSKEKEAEPHKVIKTKVSQRADNLVCEFCGKSFRQLSYLVSHKLQHKKEQAKKMEKDAENTKKLQVFSCEVCKKEFRKLHHLVQHRIIHNPDSVPKRTLRNSSSEQHELKNIQEPSKPNEETAAFRCEPCDKSFRKLHHLVEHRETHDGINRQKPAAPVQTTVEKPPPTHQCEICKKAFRKLHHLIEHKEQHADTSSDKSDDKSVQSSLSTKDIIHECSLCYMVFPNEHSLNKHSVMCSKKKRQSKQAKDISENESVKDEEKSQIEEQKDEKEVIEILTIIPEVIVDDEDKVLIENDNRNVTKALETVKVVEIPTNTEIKPTEVEKITRIEADEKPVQIEVKSTEVQNQNVKRDLKKSEEDKVKETSVVPTKIKKIDHKEMKVPHMPKKKTPLKHKVATTVPKRQKSIEVSLPAVVDELKPSVESSDDDEVRYMLNPNYKVGESTEVKTFMKIRAHKRNSLQIERPTSNDHVKRRTSLQHPPKIPRLRANAVDTKSKVPDLKPKSVETKSRVTKATSQLTTLKHISKLSEAEAVLSTDSDDSDVKYSFPKINPETSKAVKERTAKETEKKMPKKCLTEKRKSLVGIAKRKSLGKAITAKHKVNDSPAKPIRKRTTEVEHRCDCGQLFSSAALLSRHTSLAHTPPRIRRRRSPPPDPPAPAAGDKAKPPLTRKSSVKSDAVAAGSNSKPGATTRKSSVKAETTLTVTRKSIKPNTSETKPSSAKTRRSAAHSGVPVPERMRKLMQKNKK